MDTDPTPRRLGLCWRPLLTNTPTSWYEEEMEQDDDPSYVPDPKDIDADDDDTGFDDFDDCLYE